ncbi:MAG: hypothetical protein PVF70_09805 [Anaerolineales bacterium]|jgi:hypothetical protein
MMRPRKHNFASPFNPPLGKWIPESLKCDLARTDAHAPVVCTRKIEQAPDDKLTAFGILRVEDKLPVALKHDDRRQEIDNPSATLPTHGEMPGLAIACLPLIMIPQGPETVLRAFVIGAVAATGILVLLAIYSAVRAAIRPRIGAFRARRLKRQEARQRRSGQGEEPPPESL